MPRKSGANKVACDGANKDGRAPSRRASEPQPTQPHAPIRTGFFGNDCGLSMVPAGPNGTRTPVVLSDRGYTPRAAGPRVYIYDLPPELTTW